jgi:hypothetical protein
MEHLNQNMKRISVPAMMEEQRPCLASKTAQALTDTVGVGHTLVGQHGLRCCRRLAERV